MADHSEMKLGKLAPRIDRRTLRMAKYLTPDLALPPDTIKWSKDQPFWGMMRNDVLGCCTIAAIGHQEQAWTLNTGVQYTATDATIGKYYGLWDGYVDGDPSTDNGGVELDVLNAWRKTDFDGHKLLAYAAPDPQNALHIKQAISLFGGAYIGISLPLTAQIQDTWDYVQNNPRGVPGTWGGHAVCVLDYDKDTLTCVTWGKLKQMTWNFWNLCCDESYALLSPDFIAATTGKAPSGFDLATLQADLVSIEG